MTSSGPAHVGKYPRDAQTPISLPMPNARLTQLTVSPRPASPAVSGGLSEVRTDVAAGGIPLTSPVITCQA